MLTEVKDVQDFPVPHRDMTLEELGRAEAAWQSLSEDGQDILSRYISTAMVLNGITDRRARVAVMEALDDLCYADMA